jgi:hypothetical protein
MKAIAIMAAAGALTTLGACDRLGPSGSASNDKAGGARADKAPRTGTATPRTMALRQPAAPNPQQGLAGNPNVIQTSSNLAPAPIDRGYFIGRWTDEGDCRHAGEFIYDGRFTTAGGEQGTWAFAGNQLTMRFGQGPRTLRIEVVDPNNMRVINPNGAVGRSTRC